MADRFLFVYGTLRRGTETEMQRLLTRHAEFVGEALYQGRLYRIDFYPGVVASVDPSDRVTGDLYHLHDADRLLPQLDRYEACGTEFPEPSEYRRVMQCVRLADGESLPAWVYLYDLPVDGLERILSGDFLAPGSGATLADPANQQAERLR